MKERQPLQTVPTTTRNVIDRGTKIYVGHCWHMMEIKQSRRCLILRSPGCDIRGLNVLLSETSEDEGFATELRLSNAYYKATIPIWHEELHDLDAWRADYLSDDAKEVVQALGAWIYCFDHAGNVQIGDTLRSIDKVIERACSDSWEGVKLAIGCSTSMDTQALEDECQEHGFEFIDAHASGRNEFHEARGLARVKEALEANDWSADANLTDSDLEDFGDFEANNIETFDGQARESLLHAMNDMDDTQTDGNELDTSIQVENLDKLFVSALAIKGNAVRGGYSATSNKIGTEQGARLPIGERKQFAAKAINKLINEN